ncbi:MAG: electron transfer flavoprotein subunit beta/FixA family protein [Planctomycetia bacterium]|nr:MAG: electron transfer flavoprotein subunit beta/FixA family protein [Planctomycetia bacterium]
MKILVLIKQVPDSTTTIRIRPDGGDIDRAGVKMVVNPFDEFAIELAQQLREKRSDVQQITALAVGPAGAAEALRTAMAIGADDAIHLQDGAFETLDELQTAALIGAVVRDAGYDLILCGKQEIDLDSGQLGPALAERLDWAHVGAVTALEVGADGRTIEASRRIEGAEERVRCGLPALLTIEKGLVEPRYPSLPNLMKAKKKPLAVKSAADVPGFADLAGAVGGTHMHKLEPPPARPAGKQIKGEPAQQAAELVRLLREEAKVI